MAYELVTLLGFAVFGIACFLGLFYLIRNRLRDDGYIFLYFLLLVFGYEVFYKTLIYSKMIYSFAGIFLPGRFYNLLIYPLFLFFVYSVIQPDFRLRLKHFAILLLVAGFIVFTKWNGLFLGTEEKRVILDRFFSDGRPGPHNYWGSWETFLRSTLIPLGFISVIGYEFLRFRRKNRNQSRKSLLNILLSVLILLFVYHQFSNLLYKWAFSLTGWSFIEWPVDIIFLSVVVLLLVIIALSVNSGGAFLPPSKYASSSLDAENYAQLLARVTDLMEKEELYKQPQLSLQKLSRIINSNPSYLSQAVNHHLGIGFRDFIHRFRVEEAKKQLLDPQNAHLTVEAIGELCGFQSKSTFFRAFKKATGQTPSQFIRSQK